MRGTESAPGVKDHERIRAFVRAAKEAIAMIGTHLPDGLGRFGEFGGRFVPETVMAALDELEAAVDEAFADPAFHAERDALARDFVGRPSPIYLAERLTADVGGAQIWLKREDLNHTGAHKINNAVGQALLARRLGKRRIVAETGAGQHGVATATVCARFGLDAVVYMGAEDIRRQRPNVVRMGMLGAELVSVTAGAGTLKDAMNEAIRDWIATVETTHYMIGSAAGPHPYPYLVRELQAVIGEEARAQLLDRTGRLPDAVVACVGGGSNAIGLFHPFRDDDVRIVGVEAGGDGADAARRVARQRPRVDPARLALLRARGRARPGERDALDLGRPRLPGRRPRAVAPEGDRTGRVRAGDGRRRAAGVPPPVPPGGHHPGARVVARPGPRRAAGPRARAGRDRAGRAVRPRRQGRRHDHGARGTVSEARDAGARRST